MTHERERAVAVAAVREAAALAERVRAAGLAAKHDKADQSPVTVADFSAQALIARALSDAFPDDPIVGEESADALRADRVLGEAVRDLVSSAVGETSLESVCGWIDRGASRAAPPADEQGFARFWTVDPIDGTKGYLRGMGYAVGVALIVGGRPVVSAIACPWLPDEPGAVFWATHRGGAFESPLAGGDPKRIAVASRDAGEAVLVESYESAHADRASSGKIVAALGAGAPPLRIDSMLKYALVARGTADLYLRVPRGGYSENTWDHAAGVLLVEEAGGRVTTRAGASPRFAGHRFETGGALVASSGRFHDRVLGLLAN